MKFRYSGIQTALFCPEKYNLQYLQGRKSPKLTPDYLVLGTGVHLIPQTYFEGGDPIKVFKMYWRSLDPDTIEWTRYTYEDQGKMGEEWARKWLKMHAKHYEPKYIEETVEGEINGITWQGTPDFVGYYKTKPVIVDWKTSAQAYSPNKLLTDSQLWLYRELVKKAHGFEAEELVYAPFLKGNEATVQTPQSVVWSESKSKIRLDNATLIARDLLSRQQFPRNEQNCLRCDYLSVCYPDAK